MSEHVRGCGVREPDAVDSATRSGASATHANAGWPYFGKLSTSSAPDATANV